MMSRRFQLVRGGLVALSVVAVLAAALALASAERQWPTFPTYAFNLDYGPAFAGGSLEQTFAAPATPLRSIEVRAVSPWPAAVIVRLRDVGDPASPLLVESAVQVAGNEVRDILPAVLIVAPDSGPSLFPGFEDSVLQGSAVTSLPFDLRTDTDRSYQLLNPQQHHVPETSPLC